MTEQEWLTLSERPRALVGKMVGKGRSRLMYLCATACCRRVAHLMPDPRCLKTVEVAEAFADRKAKKEELEAAYGGLDAVLETLDRGAWPPATNGAGARLQAVNSVCQMRTADKYFAARTSQVAVIAAACAVLPAGEPYVRDVEVAHRSRAPEEAAQVALFRDLFRQAFVPVLFERAWRTPLVVSVAQAAYDERRLPRGELDAVRLSVLADALEEAGCGEETVLAHLPSAGPHVRGCWALDLALGK